MEGGLCVGLSDLNSPTAGNVMSVVSPPDLEPAMPLEGQPQKSIRKPRKRRRSIFGLRRKPGNITRLPTDPMKKRFRQRSVFYILVPRNPPEKQEEHEQPLQGDTSVNAGGEPTLSRTEAQTSPSSLTSPVVVARSSRVIKIPKRFLDHVMGKSQGKLSVETSKLSPGSSHLSQNEVPGGNPQNLDALDNLLALDTAWVRRNKVKFMRSKQRHKYFGQKMRMRRSKLRMEELISPGEVKRPAVLVSGANVTAAGAMSTETREEAVNYAVNIKREDGGGTGDEGMVAVDLLSNIKREEGCGEGMVMLDAENIKREDGGGGWEEMAVLDAEKIKREDEGCGEEMVVDAGNIKRESWSVGEEIVVAVDAENIKREESEEEEEEEEEEPEEEYGDEGMVVMVVEDAEHIKREDGAGGEEMVVVVKQGDISHRVNLSNKRMLHLLKRAKVQLEVDEQKQLKSSQQTVPRRNLCIDRQCICKDCSMVFHGPAQLHNHRLSLHPQTRWTAS